MAILLVTDGLACNMILSLAFVTVPEGRRDPKKTTSPSRFGR
jgi:hypothetical protein